MLYVGCQITLEKNSTFEKSFLKYFFLPTF